MVGKLIVIAGTDGSGKGTQAKLLCDRIVNEKGQVRLVDFPRYGERSAAMVEDYLNGKFGSAKDVGPFRGSIFYAIDRYAASFDMKKWLNSGVNVISNRYTSANKGHQMGKIKDDVERDKFLDWENELEYDIFGIPKEDLNIFLYVPPEIGQTLVDKKDRRQYTDKKRDLHEADLTHLQDAAEAYMYVAKKEGWTIIDCAPNGELMTIEEIHDKIWDIVKPLLSFQTTLV